MKKVVFLIGLIIFIGAIIIFALNENSRGTLVVKSIQSIDLKESNEILISEGTKDIAFDFIKSISKKNNTLIHMMYILQKKEKVPKISFLQVFRPQKVH